MWHNSVENLVLLHKMQAIRGYYRGLVPEASQFFDPPEADALHQAALGTVGLRVAPLRMLFTGASVVAAINSILGGAGLGLLAARLGQLSDSVAVVVGLMVALVLFGLHLLYQQRQGTQVGL
jgi:hypothetical protein